MASTDSAPGFELTDDQQMVQQMAREFSRKEIAPRAADYDRTHEYPWDIVRKAQELGFTTMNVAEEHGGVGFSVFLESIVWEELGWGCTGVTTALGAAALGYCPILVAGTEEQKAEYGARLAAGEMAAYCLTEPEAGSDVAGIRTRAVKDGDSYVLNGSKTFITGATVADFYTAFAKTDPEQGHRGISAFVVDRNAEGVSVGPPFDKMGQHASDTAPVMFDDVRLPAANRLGDEGTGFYTAMTVFDRTRPTTAAGAVGLAQRALDEAAEYARTRETMGVVIGKHQAIGHLLADMAIAVEAARLLTWKAAWAADRGERNLPAAYAKAFAADTAMQVATDAVQIFGGYGYMAEYPVEKLMRDAKIYQIYEGTSQIQREIIARSIVGR